MPGNFALSASVASRMAGGARRLFHMLRVDLTYTLFGRGVMSLPFPIGDVRRVEGPPRVVERAGRVVRGALDLKTAIAKRAASNASAQIVSLAMLRRKLFVLRSALRSLVAPHVDWSWNDRAHDTDALMRRCGCRNRTEADQSGRFSRNDRAIDKFAFCFLFHFKPFSAARCDVGQSPHGEARAAHALRLLAGYATAAATLNAALGLPS